MPEFPFILLCKPAKALIKDPAVNARKPLLHTKNADILCLPEIGVRTDMRHIIHLPVIILPIVSHIPYPHHFMTVNTISHNSREPDDEYQHRIQHGKNCAIGCDLQHRQNGIPHGKESRMSRVLGSLGSLVQHIVDFRIFRLFIIKRHFLFDQLSIKMPPQPHLPHIYGIQMSRIHKHPRKLSGRDQYDTDNPQPYPGCGSERKLYHIFVRICRKKISCKLQTKP